MMLIVWSNARKNGLKAYAKAPNFAQRPASGHLPAHVERPRWEFRGDRWSQDKITEINCFKFQDRASIFF